MQADDWSRNGAGYNVSHAFGFGLMDAGAMVRLALNWSTVPEQMVCMDGTKQCRNFSNPLGFGLMDAGPWSAWHSTGPQFQNRWYVGMEQSSVETLAIPLGLTNGLKSHGQAGTQLDHSSRTDGM
jgi:hypothetical protein